MDKLLHSPGLLALLFAVSALLIWLVYWLFGLYRDGEQPGRGWLCALEIDPEGIGGFRYSGLALVSALSLFLEMMMIRWMSSEIESSPISRTWFWSRVSWDLAWVAIYADGACS